MFWTERYRNKILSTEKYIWNFRKQFEVLAVEAALFSAKEI